jgi:predicted RNA binding protein YcfA (HicA-like mRNA interferase family)
MDSREIIKKIKADGWYHMSTEGSHHHFKHPIKPGKTTVPHPKKDFTKKMIQSIEKQSGLKLR